VENFSVELAEILEVDSIELSQELDSFECWDSLTILSIIALVDDTYNITLSANDISKAITIGGLHDMINSKL